MDVIVWLAPLGILALVLFYKFVMTPKSTQVEPPKVQTPHEELGSQPHVSSR